MNYNQFEFKNKPTIDEILSYRNLFIRGMIGSGKSVLLHQIVDDIMAKRDFDRFTVYIHDPKRFEFFHSKHYHSIENVILGSHEQELLTFLRNEIARRRLLPMSEIENEKTIVIICEDWFCTNIEGFLMSIYGETKPLKIMLILAAQQKNAYLKNKSVLDSGTVFFLNDPDEHDFRTIVVNQ